MGTAMNSGAGLIGIPATMSCLALLLIWGLFFLLGIRIRRKWTRIWGALLLGVALSMLLGLSRPDLLQYGYSHGGALGDWIYLNCNLSGLAGIAYFLSWIAVILSLLLATDWLFHEYITDALGIPHSPAAARKSEQNLYPLKVMASTARPMSSVPTPVLEKPVVEEHYEVEAPQVTGMTEQVEEKGIPFQAPSEDESSLPTNQWWVAASVGNRPIKETVIVSEVEEEGSLIDEPFDCEDENPIVDEHEHHDAVEIEDEAQPQEIIAEPEVEISMEPTVENTDDSEASMPPKTMDDESGFYRQAIHLVHDEQEASISLLQQRLSLGYFKAAKLMDRLEKDGVISPPTEEGQRTILISEEKVNGL